MKWLVTPKNATKFEVDIPDDLNQGIPSVGEEFHLMTRIVEENKDSSWVKTTCKIVGDGQTLQLGTHLLRVNGTPLARRKNKVLLRTSGFSISSDHIVEAKPIRPVEPKVTAASLGGGPIKSPMTGKIISVGVSAGEKVNEGDILVVIEAMKMENQIKSECHGTVEGIQVKAGDAVTVDQVILSIQPIIEAS